MRDNGRGLLILSKEPSEAAKKELRKCRAETINKKRWVVKSKFWDFEGCCKGRIANIVGKGPSLDDLAEPFEDVHAPIFGVNEAIVHVERLNPDAPFLFGMVQDKASQLWPIQKAIMLVGRPLWERWELYHRTMRFRRCEFNMWGPSLTMLACMGAAKVLGCTEINMWCFDSCVTGEPGYPKVCPESTWNKTFDCYKNHKKVILKNAGLQGLKINWRMP